MDVFGTGITPSTPHQKPLPDLVQWWYDVCLGLAGIPVKNPVEILVLALRKKERDTVGEAGIKNLLSMHIKDTKLIGSLMGEITTFVHSYSTKENGELLKRIQELKNDDTYEQDSDCTPNSAAPPTPVGQSTSGNAKRKKKLVELSTKSFSSLSDTVSKLQFVRKIHKEFLEKTEGGKKELLSPGSKRWYNRYVKVLVCLEDHLGGDIDQFIEQYNCMNDFFPSRFKCTCGR